MGRKITKKKIKESGSSTNIKRPQESKNGTNGRCASRIILKK